MSLFQRDLPPGLIYVANWLSNEEHEKVLAEIDSIAFDVTLSRRVQHYGARYDYGSASLSAAGTAPSNSPGNWHSGTEAPYRGFLLKSPRSGDR